MPLYGVIPVRICTAMAFTARTAALSPYADQAIMVRRSTPRGSTLCPRCRKQCDFVYVLTNGPASIDILCPDCGTTRTVAGIEGGKAVFRVEGTGEPYDCESNLKDARARLDAFEGPEQERCILMAEVAWETYLFLAINAPPAWKDAVDAFVSCDGFSKEQARRMVPWILRFCGLGGNKELNGIDIRACRRAVEILEAPTTADECMLWMELFDLECRADIISDDRADLPDIVNDIYHSLSESERAGRPEFPVMRALILSEHASYIWSEGLLDVSESEIELYSRGMWNEAVTEALNMLSAGAPMTPRMFRAFCRRAEPMSLSLGDAAVKTQLRALGSKSGKYGDAFDARAEIIEVLMMTRGEPIMPFFYGSRFDWDMESHRKLENAIRKLERYDDPAIVWDLLSDAYYLLFTCEGGSEKAEYCNQLALEASERLLDVKPKLYMSEELTEWFMESELGEGSGARNRAKPKAKSKKERVAEKRKAHIAKRKSDV